MPTVPSKKTLLRDDCSNQYESPSSPKYPPPKKKPSNRNFQQPQIRASGSGCSGFLPQQNVKNRCSPSSPLEPRGQRVRKLWIQTHQYLTGQRSLRHYFHKPQKCQKCPHMVGRCEQSKVEHSEKGKVIGLYQSFLKVIK